MFNPVTEKPVLDFDPPRRGDVVGFLYPEDPKRKFIKRVSGLPEEKVGIREKQLYVNDQSIQEPYKVHKAEYAGWIPENFGPLEVPSNHYFLLGDNSKDRRA